MDDIWLSVEDSDSSHSSADSDNIDSEIEAELYGMIHHENNFSVAANYQTDEGSVNNKTSELNNAVNGITNFIKSHRENTHVNNSSNLTDSRFYQSHFKKNAKNASTPLKRKSDLGQDSLSLLCSDESGVKNTSQISKQTSSNNKVTKKHCNNFPNVPNTLTRNEVVIFSSSDSEESVIWTKADNSVMKTDLKTNLFNELDTISISDSSDDSFVISSPSKRNEWIQKNFSMPNIKIGENSTDPWHINDEDLYRSRHRSRRYHNSNFKCNNCGCRGHRPNSCPVTKVVKCFICGGPHLGFECANQICFKCYGWGHHYKQCQTNYFGYCLHCHMKGHNEKECPDIWRRYHLTTSSEKFIPGRLLDQDRTVYCYNCGWAGHHGAVCKIPRNYKGALRTWPSVISYDEPNKLFKNQRSAHSSCTLDIQGNQKQQPNKTVEQSCDSVKIKKMQQPFARRANSEKSRGRKKWELFRQKKKLLKEKDFPRTPVIKAEINQFQDTIPEYISIAMRNQAQKKRRNRSRRARRSRKKILLKE